MPLSLCGFFFLSFFSLTNGRTKARKIKSVVDHYLDDKCRHNLKATCSSVAVNKVALESIWFYLTFRHASETTARWKALRAQEELIGHIGEIFAVKMCPLGLCQVYLHPCSPGHKERSLGVKGMGPNF